jgi:hypothetical protein
MNSPWNQPVDFGPKLDLPNPAELLRQFANKHLPDASKEVAELTGDEKMALCIKAGVDLTFGEDGRVITRYACGIYKVDSKFRVLVDGRAHGTTLHFKVPRPPILGAISDTVA